MLMPLHVLYKDWYSIVERGRKSPHDTKIMLFMARHEGIIVQWNFKAQKDILRGSLLSMGLCFQFYISHSVNVEQLMCTKKEPQLWNELREKNETWPKVWPSMHKPTIHRKKSKSSFLHHPLTELLLIMTMFFIFPYELLFSSYTTVSVIQLKMYTSRNVRLQFRIRTLFTNSQRTNRFVFDKYIQSSWTKLCQKVRSGG